MILFKKLLRTAWHYKAQFISMILMVAIAIGIFLGFNMEWKSIEVSTNRFFDLTGYADYRVYNTSASKPYGFTESDLAYIKNIEGIDSATRYFGGVTVIDPNAKYDDNNNASLDLCIIEDYGNPTKFVIMDGEEYDSTSDGFYLSDKYANHYNYNVGDEITIKYGSYSITKEIKALIKSGEHMICINEDNQQMMPDYSVYAYVYTTPDVLKSLIGMEIYPMIMIETDRTDTKELEAEIKNGLGDTFTLLSKEDDVSYKESRGEMEEGKTMGNFLPVIFLAIAILTMITTMQRITVNEKTQIGTLKALGFKNRRILFHYSSYGLFIGVVGGIIGVLLGFGVDYIIMNPNTFMGTYFDMDKWPIGIPLFTIFVIIGIILFLCLITFLSVRKMLKGSAAESLRPYVAKSHKALFVEKLKSFDKLSFSNKWNLRDIFRNKIRSLMTVVGIAGATLLLIAAFAFKDTFDKYVYTLENVSMRYETSITLKTGTSNEDALKLVSEVNGDFMAGSAIKLNDVDEYIYFEILNNDNDLYGVIDSKGNKLDINNDGVYISKRVQKENKINPGDIITIKTTLNNVTYCYDAKVEGVITSFSSKCVLATSSFVDRNLKENSSKKVFEYNINSIYTKMTKTEIDNLNSNIIQTMSTRTELIKTYETFMELMNTFIIILVVAAILLAIVVLYNLGVMSYFERYRQLATLKVVGFKDKTIGRILINQNIWLTIFGIIIGIPLGIAALFILIILLTADYELNVIVGPVAWIATIAIVFITSLLVSLLVAKKNKHIDMVEALKGVD